MLQKVNIAELRSGPNLNRAGRAPPAVRELAEQIATTHHVEALTVLEREEWFEVVCGERRFAALKMLQAEGRLWEDFDGVPVQVVEAPRRRASLINLAENCGRRDAHPLDLAAHMR